MERKPLCGVLVATALPWDDDDMPNSGTGASGLG
jgi:hypothetical protein